MSVQRDRVLWCTAGLLWIASIPLWGQIEVAGDLLVELDAADPSAGGGEWENTGSLGNFLEVGDPFVEEIDGVEAVTFNAFGGCTDAYQSIDEAPAGLVGLDPTRSIEVWAWNPDLVEEETLVAWGRRGGPAAGTNMSFNYGTNGAFGAVGHWGAPDLGWGATVPPALQWHHLAYTYDGTTTRVYADGVLVNSEELGAGVINTHSGTKITLANQIEANGVDLNPTLCGRLSLARVRVHDGVLSPEQVLGNFLAEVDAFNFPRSPPSFLNAPAADSVFVGEGTYSRTVLLEGFPFPEVGLAPLEGAVLTRSSPLSWTVTYDLPDPAPASFDVTLSAENSEGMVQASWMVTVEFLPPPGEIAVAGELLVSLDARDPSAGSEEWANDGTLGDFLRLGTPFVEEVAGVEAVTFAGAATGDAYQSFEDAPAGIVGLDPTRSIEAWVLNPQIAGEETIAAWGHRGGPCGSNMSFNYGTNGDFGAVGHWCLDFQDLGWNDAGGAPAAGQWHHLAYTYDGSTTRVYADGVEWNSELLGPGAINTHANTKITVANQIALDGVSLDPGLWGTLSLARLRIHDGVLHPSQIEHNFSTERPEFLEAPAFVGVPAEDRLFRGTGIYRVSFSVTGFPAPRVARLDPAGAVLTELEPLSFLLEVELPDPEPASFAVRLSASNENGTVEASWTVTLVDPPEPGAIVTAGELFVALDAANPTAGSEEWENTGTLSDFARVGAPVVEDVGGVTAVTFNAAAPGDAYQCFDEAPAGLVGLDPTRSIEAWVLNPQIAVEDTIVAWGRRGGPCGSNMSFNYGTNGFFGAAGHWCHLPGPDLGWGAVPPPGEWHHLAYTYDGTTTRVYADGMLVSFETLGPGTIDTHCCTRITVADQIDPDGVTLSPGLWGTLSLARLRIHDRVLGAFEVMNNYLAERSDFPPSEPPAAEPLAVGPVHRYSFTENADDTEGGAHGTVYGDVTFAGGQAILNNDGTQLSNASGMSPPADPPGAYIDLPNGIVSGIGPSATFEAWVTWNGPAGSFWQRIFDFGTSAGGEDLSDGAGAQYYLFLSPRSGDATLRFGYRNGVPPLLGGSERFVEFSQLRRGEEQHVAVTWDGESTTASLCLNGILVARDSAVHFALAEVPDVNNWLGRSQWPDPMFAGSYNEFRIYDYPLTPGQVTGNFLAGPDIVNTGVVGPRFVRSDVDQSGTVNLTDGVQVLLHLFRAAGLPGPLGCLDAADADDSGTLNLTDGVSIFQFLFRGGSIPLPSPETTGAGTAAEAGDCDEDPTDDAVECAEPPEYCG